MKNLIKCLLLLLCVCLLSCYGKEDDTDEVCSGNCNVFIGRIYSEDNIGIPGVEIVLSHTANGIGVNFERTIAKSVTDINGNYKIEAYIMDREFNTGFFHLKVDEQKIESSLTDDFYKPSEILNEIAPQINECLFSGLVDRSQIITQDYKIPYKTSLTVNLNNFNPTSPNDKFAIGTRVRYGFETNRFLTKQAPETGLGYANGINSTIIVPAVYGENYLWIYRFKGGLVDYANETVIINNPNNNPPLNFDF